MCSGQPKTRVFLPFMEKLNILEAVNEGAGIISVAKQYNISPTTIYKMKKNQDHWKEVDANLSPNVLKKRKVNKPVHNMHLEKSILMWFDERRLLGESVAGPMIRRKALILNKLLKGSETFKASNGWLHAFKKRHDIRHLSIEGEKAFVDIDSAIDYCTSFTHLIAKENYDMNLIFNADECGFDWKSLPDVTLAGANEDLDSSGLKVNMDRVTGLFCANADGTCALPLLVIGKLQNPRVFKNIKELPVVYRYQMAAWMTAEIFLDWYTNIFIPSVQAFQSRTQNFGKVLLLLDGARCHPPKEILNAVNENFKVEYLPPNVASLVQPMEQGVFLKAKNFYRKDFLSSLILRSVNMPVQDCIKNLNLWDCCSTLSKAFNSLTQKDLVNSWNNIFGVSRLSEGNIYEVNELLDVSEFHPLVTKLKGFENLHPKATQVWLSEFQSDPGWKPLTDQEIIEYVISNNPESMEN